MLKSGPYLSGIPNVGLCKNDHQGNWKAMLTLENMLNYKEELDKKGRRPTYIADEVFNFFIRTNS